MDIVTKTKSLMLSMGAAPVMYTMIGLSVASVAIMLERAWFFRTAEGDLPHLVQKLDQKLRAGDLEGARKAMAEEGTVEAAVVVAGLEQAERGAKAAEEAMIGAVALQKLRLERRLAFLGTLGNNAPFIGLFGTVIGIIQAFDKLGEISAQASGGNAVMGAIAEALVATAIGLAVAIPAVAAFNWFQRRIKSIVASTEALTRLLLSHLQGTPAAPRKIDLRASSSSLRISSIPSAREV